MSRGAGPEREHGSEHWERTASGTIDQWASYFVTGNHEYHSGAQQWCDFLPTLGVRALRNERVAIGRRGAAAGGPTPDLAGIDDRTVARSGTPGHGANLDAALAGRAGT